MRRTYRREDGGTVRIDLVGTPVLGSDGAPRFFLVTMDEVVVGDDQQGAPLSACLHALLAAPDLDALRAALCGAARRLVPCDVALLLVPDGDDLVERARSGDLDGPPVVVPGGPRDRSQALQALRTGVRRTSTDLLRDGRAARRLVRATGAETALLEPLGEDVGVLAVLWRRREAGLVDDAGELPLLVEVFALAAARLAG